jgi:hypothetical protein
MFFALPNHPRSRLRIACAAWRALVGLVSCAWAMASPSVAAAAPGAPTARLAFARGEGAEACGDEMEFRQAVAERLGSMPFFIGAASVLVVRFTRDKEGTMRGSIELMDVGALRGVRELASRDGDCKELFASVALAAAIVLDPHGPLATPDADAAVKDAPPAEAIEAAPPAPAVEETPPRPAPDSTPRPPPEPSLRKLSIAVGGRSSVGALPAPSLGAVAAIALEWPSVSVALEGAADLPASTTGPSRGAVRASLATGSLVPCVRSGRWFGCATLTLGQLSAEGLQISTARKADALYTAAGGRVGARLDLGAQLFLDVALDAALQLNGAQLRIDGAEAWSAPLIAGRLGVTIGRIF